MNKNVTIVTGLWDLGRGDINGWAKRDFSVYKERFFELLESDAQMCIWIPNDLVDEVKEIRGSKPTKIFIKNIEDFKHWNPFFDNIQEIRTNEDWLNIAGWLKDSPQALLEFYNPMMFTKMFMLNDSALINHFDSEYFFWIDGGLTNTVHKGYFQHDNVLDNLEKYTKTKDDKFINISYPYTGNDEIHGFKRNEIAKFCGTDYVDYVCRGGFFGGKKDLVHNINRLYYDIMAKTLKDGLMGADESLLTILSYKHADLIDRFEINGDGLTWPFFEELKKYNATFNQVNDVALYVISFNSPKQFKVLIESMLNYDPDFIEKPKKYLLDNSTDLSTTTEYIKLCEEYDFEHIKKDNLGIVRGRVFIAEHFQDSEHKIQIFFEDDMAFFNKNNKENICRNGFNRYIPNLYKKSLEILKKEKFDFLKLNFSEFYGSNDTQFSWYNVPKDFRREHWPEKPELPEHGLDPNAPKTLFKNIKSYNGLPYATGEIYICNWPILLTKEGNYKCYIETKFTYPQEQTIMSHVYQETIKSKINPGILLLTPTEHNRFDFYESSLRKEF